MCEVCCNRTTTQTNVLLSIDVKYLKYALQPNFSFLRVFGEEDMVTGQSFNHEFCSERQLRFIFLLTFKEVKIEAFCLNDVYKGDIFLLNEVFTVITCLT